MQKSKKLAAAGVVLAGVCVLTFAVSNYQQKSEEIKESGETVLSIAADDVTALSWSYDADAINSETESSSSSEDADNEVTGTQEFSFTKDESWSYDEDSEFPVSEEKINNLLSVFQDFSAAFEIDDVDDYDQYGLSDPICTINITTADKDYEIKVGDISKMDSQRYVSIDDGNVYLATVDPMESYACTLQGVIDGDVVPSFDTVSKITFTGDNDYSIEYNEDGGKSYNSSDVYFADSDGETIALDNTTVTSYLSTLSYMDLSEYATYTATEDDMATYGLDDPDLTISVDYTSEDDTTGTFTMSIARDPSETEEITDDNVDDVNAYAMVDGSKIIYKISGSTYRTLMASSTDDLRHKDIYTADTDDMTEITASIDGTEYTITSKGSGDDKKWYCSDNEVDLTDFTSALTALSADSFTNESAADKEELSLTIKLDNDYSSEISIALYRYDGTNCLVYVNDEPTAFVSRELAVDLEEAVNAIVLG